MMADACLHINSILKNICPCDMDCCCRTDVCAPEREHILRAERTLVIEGPASWVRSTLNNCIISPQKPFQFSNSGSIREMNRRIDLVEDKLLIKSPYNDHDEELKKENKNSDFTQ